MVKSIGKFRVSIMVFRAALLSILGSSLLISTSAFSILPAVAPRNVAARSATTMSLSRREALFAVGFMASTPLSVFAADTGMPSVPASERIKPRADACTQVTPAPAALSASMGSSTN